MTAQWPVLSYSDEDFGTDQWRRRMLFEQIQLRIHEQQRARFLGQLFFMAALLVAGAIIYWASQALGIKLALDSRDVGRWTTVAIATIAIAALGLAVVLWDARLRLGRSELHLLKRELDLATGTEQSNRP